MLQADVYNRSALAARNRIFPARYCTTSPAVFGAIAIDSCNAERQAELELLLQSLRNNRTTSLVPQHQHIPVVADSALLAGADFFAETTLGDSLSRDGYQLKQEISETFDKHLQQIEGCTSKLAASQRNIPLSIQKSSALIRSCAGKEVPALRKALLNSSLRTISMPVLMGVRLNDYPLVVFLAPDLSDQAATTLLSRLFVLWQGEGRSISATSLREATAKLYTYIYRDSLRFAFTVDPSYELTTTDSTSFFVFKRSGLPGK